MEQLLLGSINIYDPNIREIFDLSLTYIFFKDLDNNLIWVNNAMAHVHNMTKEEMYKFYNDRRGLSEETIAKYNADDIEVFKTGLPKYNIEEKLFGTPKETWINTHKIPMKDINGKVMGLIGFSYDITTIRQRNLEFQTLISSIPESIMIFDYNGNCLNMYPGKTNDWIHPTDIVGKNINIMRHLPDIFNKFNTALDAIKKDNKSTQNFEYMIKIDDVEHYYDALMTSYNGKKVMLVVRDITDKKKLDILQSFNTSIKELMIYNQKILRTLGQEDGNGK